MTLFSVDKVCEEIFAPEDADEEVTAVAADFLPVVNGSRLYSSEFFYVRVHVTHIEKEISQHVRH